MGWIFISAIVSSLKENITISMEPEMIPMAHTYTSSEPHRGFENIKFIYSSPEHEADSTGKLFAYNAMAHPQYIDRDMLLISYCVKTMRDRGV